MTRFLRPKYENVEIVFIAHHTEAKEVTEEEFFTRGESGGTICSSAYIKRSRLSTAAIRPLTRIFIRSTSQMATILPRTTNAA